MPSPTVCYSEATLDVQNTLRDTQVDFVTVSSDRLFVIFLTAVIDLQIKTGTTERAEEVTLTVVDPPERREYDAEEVLDIFIDQHLE